MMARGFNRMGAVAMLGAGAGALMLLAVVLFNTPDRRAELQSVTPGVNLLAQAIKDVVTGGPKIQAKDDKAVDHTKLPKNIKAQAKKAQELKSQGAGGVFLPELERQALAELLEGAKVTGKKHKAKPSAPQPSVEEIEESQLPKFGSREYRIALAKAKLDVESSKLHMEKLKREKDAEEDSYDEWLKKGFGKAELKVHKLREKVTEEVKKAKGMEAKAKRLSEAVVKDLAVRDGKVNMQAWYGSQEATQDSAESTRTVKEAKKLWAQAMKDKHLLKLLEQQPIFSKGDGRKYRHDVRTGEENRRIYNVEDKLDQAEHQLKMLRGEAPHKKVVAKAQEQKAEEKLSTLKPKPAPKAVQKVAHKVARVRHQQHKLSALRKQALAESAQGVKDHGEADGLREGPKSVWGEHAKGVEEAEAETRPQPPSAEPAKALPVERVGHYVGKHKGESLADEGGSPGRLEELASSAEAIRKAEHATDDSFMHPSSGDRVATMVYESSGKGLRAKKAHNLPLLEKKMIWNW